MKRALTLGVTALLATFVVIGNVPTQAQSFQVISNDNPQVVNENTSGCNVSSSGGTSYDTANTSTGSYDTTISIGGTISYQGGTSSPLTYDASISTNLITKPTTTISLENVVSYQDTTTVSLTKPSYSHDLLSVNTTGSCGGVINSDIPTQTPYANMTVNDTGIAYVAYDGSVTLKWESYGMERCTVNPTSESGTSGQYELQNITSNTTVTLNCTVSSEYPNYTFSPSTVQIQVLPPTFDYLKAYLSQIQPSGNKKVNLNSVSNFIDQAQKAKKTDLAQSFLQKSVDNLKQVAKGVIPSAQITKYEKAANYLSKTLPVKVVIATDGCSVTATGTPGLILQYGANKDMRMGYGDEATIPANGIITATIYAPNGWQSTAEVIDSTGLIYARDTKDVTTDSCPTPPYDPTPYNGYPEKWAVPEVGTVIDDWGYYNKTAESYVAFRVTNSGRTFPIGYGNASDWLAKATADGYIVNYPQAGDIAINTLDVSFGGPIAWYVDSVDGLGNYQTSAIRSDGNMNWSSGTVSGSSYLKYIRLP